MATKIDVTRVSVAQFCKLAGIAQSTAYEWFAGGCPRRDDGFVNLFEAVPWLNRRRVAESRAEGARSDSPALERLREAKARQEEMKAAVLSGQLVRVQDVQHDWGVVLGELRAGLMGLPSAVAPRLARMEPKELAAGLEQAIRVVVDRARARIRGDEGPATAEPKAKPKARRARRTKR